MKNSLQFITELALRSMKILAYSRLYMCESVCVCVHVCMDGGQRSVYLWYCCTSEARGLSTSGTVVPQVPSIFF